MGIQYLNRLFREKCELSASNANANNASNANNTIKQIPFADLKGKRIAIDASIYMYRYVAENTLIESMFQMISLFKKNEIIPIFVFDGKPPIEKKELIKFRREEKVQYEQQFNELQQKLKEVRDHEERRDLNGELDSLRKKFVRLRNEDIAQVKNLLTLYGVNYCEADGEADQLCAKLVLAEEVYARLSEDMDLFVYGCPRVLRYISLLNSTFVEYNLSRILECLQLTFKEFKEICVISGTDYNYIECKTNKANLYTTMTHYEQYVIYKNLVAPTRQECQDFYEWLHANTSYINDYLKLKETYAMFDLSQMEITKFNCANTEVNVPKLHKFLENFDFVFT